MPANRPAPDELLVAIREFLEQGVKPLLSDISVAADAVDDNARKALALNNAIAINLLRLLERESLLRPQQLVQEQALLRELLPMSDTNADLAMLNTVLIALIESAEFNDTGKYVLRTLQQISLAKLAIDNPAYSTFRKHHQ